MDWSTIVYAGIGGAVGGVIGRLFIHFTQKKKIGAVVTVTIVVLFSFAAKELYRNEVFPRIVPMDLSALEKESPGLESLRVNHPQKFKEMMAFLDGPSRRKNITEADIAGYRNYLIITIEDFKTRAPSEFSRKAMNLTVMQFEILKEKRPDICTAQIQGTAYPAMGPILGEDYTVQENALLKSLFAIEEADMQDPPDPVLGEEIYLTALKNALNTVGIAPDELAESSEHEKNCQLLTEIAKNSLALTDENLRLFTAYQASIQ